MNLQSTHSSLKVLHISTADNSGGSARSAYKIHNSLKKQGHESSMYVSIKVTQDPNVHYIAGNKLLQRLDRMFGKTVDLLGLQNFGYLSSLTLPYRRNFRSADIVQLYNLHHYYFNQFTPLLFGNKPLVWRLSDQWAMTGHCAYSYECNRWETGCGRCPALKEYDPLTWDTSAFLWRVKKRVTKNLNLRVVAPSKWIQRLAERSPILGRYPIHYIPNGVDSTIYSVADKAEKKVALGIPKNKIVIVFSAQGLFSERKGGKYVIEALRALPGNLKENIFLLLVGDPGNFSEQLDFPWKAVSEYKDEKKLASFYQAADIGLFPSTAENLPNSVLECMSCGVPCVSFNVGGITDAVIDGETGFLVEPKNSSELKVAIEKLVRNSEARNSFAKAARKLIEEKFTLQHQGKSFENLYREFLDSPQKFGEH